MAKAHTVVSKHIRIKKSTKAVIVTTVVSAAILTFSMAIMNSLYGQWRFNERLHAAKEEVRDDLEDSVANASKLKDSFNNLEIAEDLIPDQGDKPNSSLVLDALPSKYDFPALATSMNALAEQSGVLLDNFSGDDEELEAIDSSSEPEPLKVKFNIGVRGDYGKVIGFMRNVESSIRPITIETMNMNGSTQDMRATFAMVTYYQPTMDLEITTRNFE